MPSPFLFFKQILTSWNVYYKNKTREKIHSNQCLLSLQIHYRVSLTDVYTILLYLFHVSPNLWCNSSISRPCFISCYNGLRIDLTQLLPVGWMCILKITWKWRSLHVSYFQTFHQKVLRKESDTCYMTDKMFLIR